MTPLEQAADSAPAMRGLRSEYASIDGHRLHYWIGGPPEGTLTVLWHGFLGTGYAWREVAPDLVDAGLRVLIVDLLGFGDSDKPEGTHGYDALAIAEQVRSLAAQVAPTSREHLLVGHDMGAPPALLWAAEHPDEVGALVYIEAPAMLGDALRCIISYTPQAMAAGSTWWWILPLAPGVPQALIVGHEEQFLRWFYDGPAGDPNTFDQRLVAEYLRTFSGADGVLGAMGVYRAAFTSIEQTEPLQHAKIRMPVVGVGGERGLGRQVATMLQSVAANVIATTLDGVGHFVPEEAPREVVRIVTDLAHTIRPDQGEHR
ncbi:alpha/beta fold hydrolase [Micromonospora sp. 067-2]|uniref:alpha/beta fold hydrolase n=1 Tax=Micromonospora sp. 067-2 TaxID=2789270 RepID=UPI00397CBA53